MGLEAAGRAAIDNLGTAYEAKAGDWATSQRQNAQMLRGQKSLATQNVQVDERGHTFQYQQAQTRNNQAFFNRAGNWEDARYKEGAQAVVRVKAFSEAYFQLSRRDPTLNQYFSLGQNVLVVVNGQAVEIADDGKEVFTEDELDTLLGKERASNPLPDRVADVTRTEIASLSPIRPIAGLGALLLIVGSALLARRGSRERNRKDERTRPGLHDEHRREARRPPAVQFSLSQTSGLPNPLDRLPPPSLGAVCERPIDDLHKLSDRHRLHEKLADLQPARSDV